MKRARLPAHKPRNLIAVSPLLHKGGAHSKSNAAKRRAANVAVKKLARDPEAQG